MVKILREPEILERFGIGKTSFKKLYIDTGRFSWVTLGPRMKGGSEDEVEALLSEVIAAPRSPLPPAVPHRRTANKAKGRKAR